MYSATLRVTGAGLCRASTVWRFRAVCAAALASTALSLGSDMEVGSGKPFATIQDGINAAVSGVDRVVVYDGTYNEQVLWNKAVDIVAADGNSPLLKFAVPGKNDVVFVSYDGTATWDGIDIQHDQPNDAGTVFNNNGPVTRTTNVRNITINDTENAFGNVKTFFTNGGVNLNLDHVTVNMLTARPEGVLFCQVNSHITASDCVFNTQSDKHTWINQATGPGPLTTKITCNRCFFTKPDGGGVLVMSYNGEIELNDCRLVLDGGSDNVLFPLNQLDQLEKMTLNRCVLDSTGKPGGSTLVNMSVDGATDAATTTVSLVNCALLTRRDQVAVNAGANGTLSMTHCTLTTNAESADTTCIAGPASGKTMVMTLANNIFSFPGSTKGAIAPNATPGTLTLTAGTNLRNMVGSAEDLLTGTVIDADPALDADLIHLTGASPAINAAVDLGIDDDIDGDARPGSSTPPSADSDLGADEFTGEQVMPAPSGLAATAGDGTVDLTWMAPSGGGPAVAGYNVYQTRPGARTKLNVDPVAGTNFNVPGLANGVEACFVVTSVGAGGLESADSNEACATPETAGGSQKPGDMNQDGKLDISDASAELGHLFLGTFPLLPCEGGSRVAADPGPGNLALLDSNGDTKVDISDVIYNLNFLFNGGLAPVLGTACIRIAGCPEVCTP